MTITVALSNSVGGTMPDSQAIAYIGASDAATVATPTISVADAVASEGQGYAEFVVSLSAPSAQAVSVNYGTVGNTASGSAGQIGYGGNDYAPIVNQSATLSFAPGETVKTVRVALGDDTVAETTESFYLSLTSPINGLIGKSQATGNIIDNDGATGTPVITFSDVVVDEKAGRAVFTLTLDRPSTTAVSLTVASADGSAVAGLDYQALTAQSVAFAPGEMVKTVAVNLIDDAMTQPGEYFSLVLSNPLGAALPDTRAIAYIGASDAANVATPTISVADAVASEGQGYAEFVVSLSAPSAQAVSVNYGTVGNTASGSAGQIGYGGNDYAPIVNQSATLSFAPGETVKTVRVALGDDTIAETTESFYLSLTSPINGLIGKSQATGNIVDNDAAAGPPVSMLLVAALFAKAVYYLLPGSGALPSEPIARFVNDRSPDAENAMTALLANHWSMLGASELTPSARADLHLPNALYIDNMYWDTWFVDDFKQSPEGFDYQFRSGIFTNRNAAALVGIRGDTLVISFRGTNDVRYSSDTWWDWSYFDPLFGDSPDQEHWFGKDDHWDLFEPLIAALDDYISSQGNGVREVYVTGHSLGAAMVQPYLDSHDNTANLSFHGVTFASPGYGIGFDDSNDRLVNFWIEGDAIQTASNNSENKGDKNEFRLVDMVFPAEASFDVQLRGEGFAGAQKHSMSLYLHVVERLQAAGLDVKDFVDLGGANFDNLFLKVNVEHREWTAGDDFDDYYVFSEPDGSVIVVGDTVTVPAIIVGTSGGDQLTGGSFGDVVYGGSGNDMINGSAGVDAARYSSNKAGASFAKTGSTWSVTTSTDGTDTLTSIERLSFSDFYIALDLDGNAGIVAKILGAVFGAPAVSNKSYAGIGLQLSDGGMGYGPLMQLALDAALGAGASHSAVVTLLYTNVVGVAPGPADLASFVGMLDRHEFTPATLGILAADHPLNTARIDLVGLALTGIEFIPQPGG